MENEKPNTDTICGDDLTCTPLSWAVKKGDYLRVEKLLKDDSANVNWQDSHGRTPFSIAADHLRVDIMQLLLRNGADPHREDKDCHTGFWWFLKARHNQVKLSTIDADSLNDLIGSLPRPNNQDSWGRTWLSWAAEFGDLVIVEAFLYKKVVDVNLTDRVGAGGGQFAMTPLLWAAEKGHGDLVDLMTRNKSDHSLSYLIKHSRNFGQEKTLSLVRFLLSWGDNFISERCDFEGKKPLHLACQKENEGIVDILINERTRLNDKDSSDRIPLQCALSLKNKRIEIVNRILSSMSHLDPVQSLDWFNLKVKGTTWIEISKITPTKGFGYRLIDKTQGDMFRSEGKRRFYICAEDGIWSDLPEHFDAGVEIPAKKPVSRYIQFIRLTSQDIKFVYISVALPFEDHFTSQGHESLEDPWGVAWVEKSDSEGEINVAFSKITEGWIPNTGSELFCLMLENLERKWIDGCSVIDAEIAHLRKKQMAQKGHDPMFIDQLANTSLFRANVRDCLKSQISKLGYEIKFESKSAPAPQKQKMKTLQRMEEILRRIESSSSASLDEMERSIRELLQIELAWVSRNEAASIKRISWITFIFLPLMFASSLFGMNVNVLEGNPDWRWYILFAASCTVLTGALWKFFIPFSLQLFKCSRI